MTLHNSAFYYSIALVSNSSQLYAKGMWWLWQVGTARGDCLDVGRASQIVWQLNYIRHDSHVLSLLWGDLYISKSQWDITVWHHHQKWSGFAKEASYIEGLFWASDLSRREQVCTWHSSYDLFEAFLPHGSGKPTCYSSLLNISKDVHTLQDILIEYD